MVKRYDTSRPVTAALAGVVSNITTFPENMDVVGYYYQVCRYYDDHKANPNRIVYGSENGMSLSAWNALDSNVFLAGQYLWTGIDYLVEAHHWPSHRNGAGLLDLARFPKPEYYFRQSLWANKPIVYIGTTLIPDTSLKGYTSTIVQAKPDWNFQNGERVRVNCFTNCSQAGLFSKGRSLGKKRLSQFPNRIIYWDVEYQPGELLVNGFNRNGVNVNYSLKTSGEPYAITVNTDVPSYSKPSALVQPVIKVVDINGIPVYSADNEIKVEIDGLSKLLGLGNGGLSSLENYKSSKRKVLNGKLLAYIKADLKQGTARVLVSSPGLKCKALQMNLLQMLK